VETMPVNKNEHILQENYNLNLTLLEEKVIRLVDMVKTLKFAKQVLDEENQVLKNHIHAIQDESLKYQEEILKLEEESQMLQHQLMKTESSLVSETKDLEELSQEKMMTKMIVDDLIRSIDSLVDQKE